MDYSSSSISQSVRVVIFGLVLTSLLLMSATVESALNRNTALAMVKQITADYASSEVSVYINNLEGEADPGLIVNDQLSFSIKSRNKRYLLLVLVDPKGVVSIVFPDMAIRDTPAAYSSFNFPPDGNGSLMQGEPAGVETVILLASTNAISVADLGMASNSDVQLVGGDENSVGKFVDSMNKLLQNSETDATVYQYFVDSDVQHDTRALRRELKKRVDQVDVMAKQDETDTDRRTSAANNSPQEVLQSDTLTVNDIRFETNSDILMPVSRLQLDLIGSEMLNIWEENPAITVQLEGHTDDTGVSTYNQSLSERRAVSAKRYLVDEYGLSEGNIFTSGMGETQPLSMNVDSASRALNRRVEIRIGLGTEK